MHATDGRGWFKMRNHFLPAHDTVIFDDHSQDRTFLDTFVSLKPFYALLIIQFLL